MDHRLSMPPLQRRTEPERAEALVTDLEAHPLFPFFLEIVVNSWCDENKSWVQIGMARQRKGSRMDQAWQDLIQSRCEGL